jgi:Family of unknown function (DUF6474)
MARPRTTPRGTPRITPSNAKRAIGVAKIVLPVLAPYAIRAAGYARHQWDAARARRLGVGVDQLPTMSGRGAALHARLARLTTTLRDIAERHPSDTDTEQRLADLATAVRAAELMPAPRRRAAYKAIGAELDTLEAGLLRRLGL